MAQLAETFDGALELRYRKLILATGARELFLPFPGWTLPGVTGAGGLQALVKSGWPIEGKKVVVAGAGPLLLAVAAYLRKRGAEVLLIAEQASLRSLLSFGFGLWRWPGKIIQAIKLKRELAGVPHLAGCWPVAANGKERLQSVKLRRGRKTWEVTCDYLACGFHLVPNTELAVFFGCEAPDDVVRVDEFQETTVPGIYCAGESTGIGGLELSLMEGRIAGLAATDQREKARALFYVAQGETEKALKLYNWFLPLLRLDTVPKFVQLIKLAQQEVGMGNARVRPPRLELAGAELEQTTALIRAALRDRPTL